MEDYRVNLGVYNGPLDLLLYLIRREEVDIYDIPIARITGQYLQYVEVIQTVDPDLAGEFMVLAATLMEIKTRMLLPAQEISEDGEVISIDPRAELVRQLLQYKAFKDAAGDLEDAAARQALRFPRAALLTPTDDDAGVDIEDVQIWDLFDAFSKIMEAIGHRPTHHEVIYDDTPVELHAADIVDRLGREGGMTFDRIFEGRTSRVEVIGLFLALLELIRRKKVLFSQNQNFGRIYVEMNPNPPPDDDADAAGAEAPPGDARSDASEPGPLAGEPPPSEDQGVATAEAPQPDAQAAPPEGTYVADALLDEDEEDFDDDSGTETEPTGD